MQKITFCSHMHHRCTLVRIQSKMILGRGFSFGLIPTTFLFPTVIGFLLDNGTSTADPVLQQTSTNNSTTVAHVTAPHVPSTVQGPVVTSSQTVCRDTIDNCSQYGRTACTNTIYEAWTKAHCAMYCGHCTPPIPLPQLCEDKIHNCAEYDSGDLCTDDKFYTWAYNNCKGYCRFDMCNESWCEDSKGANCALLDTALNFCADIDKAKTICRKHCDLCNVTDGVWCSWGTWSACDTSCGNGTEVRTRQCACPAPTAEGKKCTGDDQLTQQCSMDPCPVNGGWSSWTDWKGCSVTCGIGMRNRKRFCNNPSPSLSGDHCFGDSVQYDVCAKAMCSADGNWTTWNQWTTCSKTCGYGIRTRNRTCTVGNFLLQTCSGLPYEYETCPKTSCMAVDGGWSLWGSWSKCSRTICSKERSRSCRNPTPSEYGKTCLGNYVEKTNCDLNVCSHISLQIRLRNGTSTHSGRVEVSLDGIHWGTVCDDNFTNNSAKVVCRMLGYPTSNARVTSTTAGASSMPIYLDNVTCTGYEASLLYCKHKNWLDDDCSHSEDIGVICS